MKYFLLLAICLYNTQIVQSQAVLLTTYHDSTWRVTKVADHAFYLCDFKLVDKLFLCECFWKKSEKLKFIAMKDRLTKHSQTIGLEISYFENNNVERTMAYDEKGKKINEYNYFEKGTVADSIFYNEEEVVDSAFHYFLNGKTKAIYHANKPKSEALKVFDSLGNRKKLSVDIYHTMAHLGKDDKDWRKFLQENLNANTPIDNNGPEGIYQVIIRFIVGKDGTISDIRAETALGYGMEEDAIRVIKKSPKWTPEIFLGEVVVGYRRQPVTYVVSGE